MCMNIIIIMFNIILAVFFYSHFFHKKINVFFPIKKLLLYAKHYGFITKMYGCPVLKKKKYRHVILVVMYHWLVCTCLIKSGPKYIVGTPRYSGLRTPMVTTCDMYIHVTYKIIFHYYLLGGNKSVGIYYIM